jgi:hypothetical protein
MPTEASGLAPRMKNIVAASPAKPCGCFLEPVQGKKTEANLEIDLTTT